ncbi:AAA family ATPase [Patescibacteria group bacterium]|nr:AAA family ATPase [Patescibacteria group bacterium]
MEENWGMIGHQKIVQFLDKSIKVNRLAHAYLFYGQGSLGKTTLAEKFAETLLKTPEAVVTDLYKVGPLEGKKNIAIEQVREWRLKLQMKSLHQGYKVGIIYEAEKLNLESANALLKTIEEPTPQTVIILITSAWDKILPTIISRSQLIRFSPVINQEIINCLSVREFPAAEIEKMVNFVGGYPGKIIAYLESPELFTEFQKLNKEVIKIFNSNLAERFLTIDKFLSSAKEFNKKVILTYEFLKHFRIIFRDMLLKNYNLPNLLQNKSLKIEKNYSVNELLTIGLKMEEAENQLKSNVQPRLILENLMLHI